MHSEFSAGGGGTHTCMYCRKDGSYVLTCKLDCVTIQLTAYIHTSCEHYGPLCFETFSVLFYKKIV